MKIKLKLLSLFFALFLLPLAVMGQCGSSNLSVTDADGNTYATLKVGSHCWMQSNLKTRVPGSSIYWADMYPDTTANLEIYGRLYNWYAAMNVQPGETPVVNDHGFVQGVCPEGWHLPNDVEVAQLMTNTTPALHDVHYWLLPGTNTTNYTMRPGGYYNANRNRSEDLCGNSYMWTAQSLDESSPSIVWSDCHCDYFLIDKTAANNGMSVRCVYKIYQGTVTTDSATNITDKSATLYGTVAFNGYDEEYERGFVYGTSSDNLDQWVVENQAASEATAPFNKEITGLSAATTYYYQAYVVNDFDTAWGEIKDFTTLQMQVSTDSANTITHYAATLHGNLIYLDYTSVNAGFKYGTSEDALTTIVSDESAMTAAGQFSFGITGLTANTQYYYKAFAAHGTDTVYGEVKNFTTAADVFTCGTSKVKDIDNNEYNTVPIGTQCWMKENLRTTKYANGTAIAPGSSTSNTTAYYYAPNGDNSNVATYGYLYNWAAVMNGASSSDANPSGVQGICPTGWHVPSDAEWTQLTNYVSSQSQYVCGDNTIAKALASTAGWNTSGTTCAVGNIPDNNNKTGFSALPAGGYYGSYGSFGNSANLWSATERNSTYAYGRNVHYTKANVSRDNGNKSYAFSVRCLRDATSGGGGETTQTGPTVTTGSVSAITSTSATVAGNVTADGNSAITACGVCYGTTANPDLTGNHVEAAGTTGEFTVNLTGLTAGTTYYVRAYATNSVGTAYGEAQTFTTTTDACNGVSSLTDIDGNTYNTVAIGTQCWMKENLRTTKYANGTAIAPGSSTSNTTAYYYAPNGDNSNVATYGYLYNWAAVMNGASSSDANPSGVQGICPTGWHVPSDAEWTQLTNYVSSQSQYVCGDNTIAKALASTAGWNTSGTTCAVGNIPDNNNKTGFSALPAGGYGGSYYGFGSEAYLWSATEDSSTDAFYRILGYYDAGVYRYGDDKNNAVSVRCLRD